MAAPRTTLWKLEPHTAAKHAILRRYLQAWAPIVGGRFPEVVYIDGFAGPGQYEGGEDGSPLIALKAALDHAAKITASVHFLFVEKDAARAAHLSTIVGGLSLPARFTTEIASAQAFEAAFAIFRTKHSDRAGRLPPTFAFIDPFGWTGVPFSIVRDILAQPHCEVLVNFMYEEINRFLEHPDQDRNFDALSGTGDWRSATRLAKPAERSRALHDLYARQLKGVAGARYVRSFCMRNRAGATDYYLFHATNSLLGLKRMKEAMWKVDRSGAFTFSDATDPDQLVLLGDTPRLDHLETLILDRFASLDTTVAEVEAFVVGETAFRETHYKGILKSLERSTPPRLLALGAPSSRRAGTYGSPSLRLRFTSR